MQDDTYKLDKTAEDIDNLLMKHKNLVYHMLTKMQQLQNQDAESAAWEALWDALGTFDVFSGFAFSTYACKLIKNAINGVLRKQQVVKRKQSMLLEVTEQQTELFTCDCTEDAESAELVSFVDKMFEEYLFYKRGHAKSVLLFWRSSNFTATVSNMAVVCNCTASYISRVQNDFRAYLSCRLKEF